MLGNGNDRQRHQDFVAKSLRAWEGKQRRPNRSASTHRPYRRRKSGLGQVYGLAALAIVVAAAVGLQGSPGFSAAASSLLGGSSASATSAAAKKTARNFPICGAGKRINCVVDGDTFWIDGEKIRIADINAPEISSPKCSAEKARGDRATRRLQSLLNAGAFETKGSGTDKYGRRLRMLDRNGRSLGDTLVAEGLAHRWNGYKESWCG